MPGQWQGIESRFHGRYVVCNVISLYEAKSIIIFSSPFAYFQFGQREAWQLLDAWEVARFSKLDTKFCFLGITDLKPLQEWGKMLLFPLSTAAPAHSLGFTGRSSLAAGLDPMYHDFTVRKPGLSDYQYSSHRHRLSFTWDLTSALMKNVRKDSANLSKAYPLRRFVLSSNPDLGSHSRTGAISVHEGLPEPTNISMSSLPLSHMRNALHSHHIFIFFTTRAFDDQVEIFWSHAQWCKDTSYEFDAVVLEQRF
jgi:hypothetical protein